jgi:hypothetical protein
VTADEYDHTRSGFFLVAVAVGVALGIWAWSSGSQTKPARWIRTADSGWWWIAAAVTLLVTVALAFVAP